MNTWTRQSAEIDPSVEPVSFTRRPDGRVAVEVQQVVRALDRTVVNESLVMHVYTLRGGLVSGMDVE